jgi:hypothetical protein
MGPAVIIKKPVLSGTTHFLDLFVHPPDSPTGFKPDLLTLSVYDVAWAGSDEPRRTGDVLVFPDGASYTIVNGRSEVDVTASCDDTGNAVIELTPEDMTVSVPASKYPSVLWRYILVAASWGGSPGKVSKAQIAIAIMPDREGLAV